MITIKTKTPYLAITFTDILNVDTIQNLKEGIGMMSMCFKGKPTKADIVKMYDKYVKENPADVLRCLRPDELTLMDKILKQGRGGHVTVKGVELYNQLQKMNLVVSHEDKKTNTTDIYLIDELHTVFAPHIDNVINNPIDYRIEKSRKTPLDSTLYEVSQKSGEIISLMNKWTYGKKLLEMSHKELDRFSDALFEYEDELDEYEGKLTTIISANPQGFAERQEDIDMVKNIIGDLHNSIIKMQEMLDEVCEMKTSDECDEDAEDIDKEEKEQLEKLFNSKTVKDAIEQIKKDRLDAMDEAERAEREDGPVKYQPAFTKHPAKYPPLKISYCGTRLVRPRIFEVTLPMDDGLYFIVYFHYLEQNGYTQATCYWGNVFDFAQKAAAEPYPGAGYVTLSKSFRKKYPHVSAVYGMQEDNEDCLKPYLTTIGWDGQPKEWFLSVRLWDFDYTRLITLTPLECQEALDAIDALRDASLAMMHDIQRSDAKQPKQLMNDLFGI